MYVIALEIRLRSVDEPARKAIKQLKEDLAQLVTEETTRVAYTFELDKVQTLADLFFRQYNIEHQGHNIV